LCFWGGLQVLRVRVQTTMFIQRLHSMTRTFVLHLAILIWLWFNM